MPKIIGTGSKDGRIACMSGRAREREAILDKPRPKMAPPGKVVPKPAKPKKPKPQKTHRENTTSISCRGEMRGARGKQHETAMPEEDIEAKILPGKVIPKKYRPVKDIPVKGCPEKAVSGKVMEKSAVSKNDMAEKVIPEIPPNKDSPEMAASEHTLVKTILLKDTTQDNTVPKAVMSENEEAEWMPRASVKEHEYEELDDIADEDPPPPCKKKPVVTAMAEPPETREGVSREHRQAEPSRSLVTSCDDPLQPSPALGGTSTYIVAPETDKPSPEGMTRPPRFLAPLVSGTALSPLATSSRTPDHTCSSAREDPEHLSSTSALRSLAPSVDVATQSSPPESIASVDLIAARVLKMLDERSQCPPSGRRLPTTSTTTDGRQCDCKSHTEQFYTNM